MRHRLAFELAVQQRVGRIGHLILITGQLRRHRNAAHGLVGVVIDVDGLGIVDIGDHQITLGAPHIAAAVGGNQHRTGGHGHRAVAVIQRGGILRIHTGFGGHHRRIEMIKCTAMVGADRHIQEVQRIHAHIEQRATGTGRIGHTCLAGHRIAQVGARRFHLADLAGLDNFVDELAAGHVARPDGLRAQHAGFLGHGQRLTCLPGVRGERLLHQHVLAGFHTQDRLFGVQTVRGGDIHQIHIRVRHQLLIRSISLVKMPLVGKSLRARNITGRYRIRVNP